MLYLCSIRNDKKLEIMKNVTVKSVKKLVIENNIIGKISMSFDNGIHTIKSDAGSLVLESSKVANKVFRILKFELFFNTPENLIDQDEFDGLCQANQLGLKTFECTILG